MAHEIFGDRFLGRRQPAWHGLGQTFTEQVTAVQAIERAKVDFTVMTTPLTATVPVLVDGKVINQEMKTGYHAIVRQPTHDDPAPRIFTVKTDAYTPIQNRTIAETLDKAGLTAMWPVETVGALGQGERLFLSLAVGEFSVADEEVQEFFLISNGHDGSMGLRIQYTPVRVVCQNTLMAGQAASTITARIPHQKNVETAFSITTDVMAAMKQTREQMQKRFQAMGTKKIDPKALKRIVEAAYPQVQESHAAKMRAQLPPEKLELLDDKAKHLLDREAYRFRHYSGRTDALRSAAYEMFETIGAQNPTIANTVWCAYQAVTETENWREARSNPGESILFGSRGRSMAAAFDAAAALVAK